jgi:signal peptidase II
LRFRRLKNWAVLFSLALFLLALDQVTKYIVRQNLAVGEAWAPIPALSKIFTITHVRNTGVAFGQLPGLGWIFMLVNIGVLVAVLVYYPRIPAGQWSLRLAMGLVLAGDLGNVIDRLRTAFLHAQTTGSLWASLPHAYVTDFFDFKIWAVFNIADMCVVSGTAIIAWVLWQAEKAAMAREQPVVNDQ